MKTSFTPHFQRSYQKLPDEAKRAFKKQVNYLLKDILYPSLRAKKYSEGENIWQARITKSYRLYFQIKQGTYIFHDIVAHKK